MDNPLGGRGGGTIRKRSLLEVGTIPAGSQDKLQDPPEDSPSALEVAEDRSRVLYGWGRAGALPRPRTTLGDKPKAGNGGRPSEGCVGLRAAGNGGAGFEALVKISHHLVLNQMDLGHEARPSKRRVRTAVRMEPRPRLHYPLCRLR